MIRFGLKLRFSTDTQSIVVSTPCVIFKLLAFASLYVASTLSYRVQRKKSVVVKCLKHTFSTAASLTATCNYNLCPVLKEIYPHHLSYKQALRFLCAVYTTVYQTVQENVMHRACSSSCTRVHVFVSYFFKYGGFTVLELVQRSIVYVKCKYFAEVR